LLVLVLVPAVLALADWAALVAGEREALAVPAVRAARDRAPGRDQRLDPRGRPLAVSARIETARRSDTQRDRARLAVRRGFERELGLGAALLAAPAQHGREQHARLSGCEREHVEQLARAELVALLEPQHQLVLAVTGQVAQLGREHVGRAGHRQVHEVIAGLGVEIGARDQHERARDHHPLEPRIARDLPDQVVPRAVAGELLVREKIAHRGVGPALDQQPRQLNRARRAGRCDHHRARPGLAVDVVQPQRAARERVVLPAGQRAPRHARLEHVALAAGQRALDHADLLARAGVATS